MKWLVLVPVVLMVISIYLASTHLVLDSSLAGGVSITMQSNSIKPTSQIAGEVSSALHVPSPSIQRSSGTIVITIATNQSLSDAYQYLLQVYSYDSKYNTYIVNETATQQALTSAPGNQTLLAQLAAEQNGINESTAGISTSLAGELAALAPFGANQSFNRQDVGQMVTTAQNSYTAAGTVYESQVINKLHSVLPFTSYSYQQITVQQSQYFLSQLRYIIIVAFILVSIIVFFIFRTLVPSFAVIFGAANDMIIALGAMAVLQIPLGIASIGGLLMLMGYSIDTDVLTSIRIIKRHEGSPEDRAYSSMRTGLTMTLTAIVSFAVLFVVSLVAYIPTYYEISGVVLFGLIGDIATTWLGNASIILLYMKRKEKIRGS